MNNYQITGNLGRDAELTYKAELNRWLLSFVVAVEDDKVDVATGQIKENTLWVRCSKWSEREPGVAKHLVKGRRVFVQGKLRQPSVYVDDGGITRTSIDVTVAMLELQGAAPKKAETMESTDDVTEPEYVPGQEA